MLSVFLKQAAFAQTPMIRVGQTVLGTIATDEVQSWQLDVQNDMDLSVFVRRTSGDLDPRMSVYDSQGNLVSQNDDAVEGIIFDASTTFLAQANEQYTIQVEPFKGSGSYQLLVLPTTLPMVWDSDDFDQSITRWNTPYTRQENNKLIYETGRLIDRTIVVRPVGYTAISDAYLHVEFTWRTTERSTTFGLVLRTIDDAFTPDGYYFNLNPLGEWAIVRQQFGQLTVLDEGTIELASNIISLGASTLGEDLALFVDGQQVTQIEDSTFSSGGWGLLLRGDGRAAGVEIERFMLTTAVVVPPDTPSTLESWRSIRADEVTSELAEAMVITDGGRRVYTILDTGYQIAPQTTRAYTQLPDDVLYDDIVVNIDVVSLEGSDIACGLTLRDNGNTDRVIVYVGTTNDAGVIVVRNGMILSHTYDFITLSDEDRLNDNTKRLTIILRGPYVITYINGIYFNTQYSPPSQGTVGVILLNYAADAGRCQFQNLWIWQ